MKLKSIRTSIILLIVLVVTSCVGDDTGQPINNTPGTFQIIASSENHTILEQALIDTGLDEVLNTGVYTVFAPDDEAFEAVDLSSLSNEELTNILLNHVINGNATSTDFSNAYIKTNATESFSGNENLLSMYVNVDGGITLNGEATVTEEDITAINGTVHVVDAIIPLPTVVTLAAANPSFSNLAVALTQENLLDVLSTDFNTSPAPFTVFAPDNTAFENFITEDNGFDTTEQILDSPILSDILTYHVLPEAGILEEDISDGAMPATVQGESLTINTVIDVTITDQNDRIVNVIATDLIGTNGVVHVIDNILLPTLP
jgi:uncharacterized surface protein with fasciclin (FAS1) repeats